MLNIRFRIILVISIVVFCAVINGCVMNEKNAYFSPSNDPLSNDYNPYLFKIWVVKDWEGGSHNYHTSFFITKIENGMIEGKFITGAVANSCIYRIDQLGDFSGTINNGIAECLFIQDDGYSDDNGYKGKVTLFFRENYVIEAEIEYAKRLNELDFRNGKYLYRPYNLADIADIDPLKTSSFSTDLDYWGNVNFVTVVIDHGDKVGNKLYPLAFLTNDNNDVFCDFSIGFEANTKIIDAEIEDINDDGLKDIKIITAYFDYDTDLILPDIPHTEWIFLRMDNGLFFNSMSPSKSPSEGK